MLVLWNQAVHTDREVTANMQAKIIKNKKRDYTHTDTCGNTCEQKYHAKGSRIGTKMQELMYRSKMNVEREMYDYTSNKVII
jgi:hypothetical protein